MVAERIRIHPACDWFMRGETHATIIKESSHLVKVRGEHSAQQFWLPKEYVLTLEGEPKYLP